MNFIIETNYTSSQGERKGMCVKGEDAVDCGGNEQLVWSEDRDEGSQTVS